MIAHLFIDGSCHPQTKIGIGSAICIEDINLPIQEISKKLAHKKFLNTSSTKLEIENFLWAMKIINPNYKEIYVYTDSQNIVGLPGRRLKLESNNYFTSTGNKIKNANLYQEFYHLIDAISCTFIKIKGHQKQIQKDNLSLIFSLVDKGSRSKLRELIIQAN